MTEKMRNSLLIPKNCITFVAYFNNNRFLEKIKTKMGTQ